MNLSCSTTNLLAFLFPWHRARLAEQVGGEVARACRAEFWRRVGPRVGSMSVSEIRGYVRAFAEDHIIAEVDHVLSRRRLSITLRPYVVASGVEQLINLAVRDALSEELSTMARPLAA